MVEVNEDPVAVTMKIQRETRAAKRLAEAERAAAGQGERQAQAARQPGTLQVEAAEVVPVRTPRAATDPEAAFRTARLGIAAVLVLVLVWACIRSARWRASRAESRFRRGV